MSTTSIEAFDTTVQKTNEWLGDISRELGDDNPGAACAAGSHPRAVARAGRSPLIEAQILPPG